MESLQVQCYNKGCGQKFDLEKNTNESCTYHPGPPYFHDAYKIWKCCDKKSTDFSTWLSYKGCTKGPHNPEKPPDVIKQVAQFKIRPENPEEVIIWNGLNKPAERATETLRREFVSLRMDVYDSALETISKRNTQILETQENGKTAIGTTCKNNACKETFKGAGVDEGSCFYHPGVAIFHEGMKYWTCCQKKTSDFSNFLDQIGCTTGSHCWTKNERVDKVRNDWFSRSGFIHFNIYCKGCMPDRCVFDTDGLSLRVRLVYGFGDKEYQMNCDLWGEIVPSSSCVNISERKVELVLKQATADGWPKLLFTDDDNSGEKVKEKSDELEAESW